MQWPGEEVTGKASRDSVGFGPAWQARQDGDWRGLARHGTARRGRRGAVGWDSRGRPRQWQTRRDGDGLVLTRTGATRRSLAWHGKAGIITKMKIPTISDLLYQVERDKPYLIQLEARRHVRLLIVMAAILAVLAIAFR